MLHVYSTNCMLIIKSIIAEELKRERESTTSVNHHCYYFAAGSFILNFKEALLEVADIERRDEFIHDSRVEIH